MADSNQIELADISSCKTLSKSSLKKFDIALSKDYKSSLKGDSRVY